MRFIAIGLAAAFFAAALSPVAAYAADKPAAKPAADITADPKRHEQGMKEAPPLLAQTGVACTVSDSIFQGQAKGKDAAGKDVSNKYYEVSCQEGLGYIVQATDGGPVAAYDCLAMSSRKPKAGEEDKGQIYCRLPGNADPLKAFQPVMAKAGVPECAVSEGTYVGSSVADKVDEYEIGCSNGDAYILQFPRKDSAKTLVAASCLTMDAGKCGLFPKEKLVTKLTAMSAGSNRNCQITNGRYIGTAASNKHSYFEVACSDDKAGYVLEVDAGYKYVGAIDCARATGLNGGCTLTSAAAAQTEELATYNRLAKQIGYSCDVKGYRSLGQEQSSKREVVELACNDHPDGAFALLPVDAGQKGEYFNCVRAELRGLKCVLTPSEATYAKISSEITAAGKSCQVSNARAVGKTTDGSEYVEVACTGASGGMVEYVPDSEKVKALTPCAQAAGVGGGCKLGK